MGDLTNDILKEAIFGDTTVKQRLIVWRILLILLFTLHILWAGGWVPGYADSGFVTIQEFASTKTAVLRVEMNQLEAKIEIAQERVCKATQEGNADALRYAAKQRNQFVQEYHRVTDEDYPVPTCRELGYDTASN